MRLASEAKARVPCSRRVPKFKRRAITQWRNRRSAALWVSGRLGSNSGWTIASQLFSISRQISPSFTKENCVGGVRTKP